MNKEEIKYVQTQNGYKITMPLLTDDELEKIDFNFHSIVDEYIKEFSNKREKAIEQRLIYDLQQENKQLKEELLEKKCSDKDVEYQEKLKLQERIDKAIVILNAMKHVEKFFKMGGCKKKNVDKLLEILKGSD